MVTDPNPDSRTRSPLRTYLECIRQAPECDHLLIVQDDAWPCDGFREKATAFIEQHSDAMCAFFVPGIGSPGGAVKRALKRHETAAMLRTTWIPTVALSWPQEAAQAFLEWAGGQYNTEVQRGDDGPVGKWRRLSGTRCMAAVPSLVQHPDVVDSIFRKKAGRAGANKARVARSFAA